MLTRGRPLMVGTLWYPWISLVSIYVVFYKKSGPGLHWCTAQCRSRVCMACFPHFLAMCCFRVPSNLASLGMFSLRLWLPVITEEQCPKLVDSRTCCGTCCYRYLAFQCFSGNAAWAKILQRHNGNVGDYAVQKPRHKNICCFCGPFGWRQFAIMRYCEQSQAETYISTHTYCLCPVREAFIVWKFYALCWMVGGGLCLPKWLVYPTLAASPLPEAARSLFLFFGWLHDKFRLLF